MIIGVPKEVKADENRVGMLPVGARALVEAGHTVYIEREASHGAGVPDADHIEAGALLLDTADDIYGEAEMIVKVKEPQPEEFERIREGQVVITYFHFAASEELTRGIAETRSVAIACETVTDRTGQLPPAGTDE